MEQPIVPDVTPQTRDTVIKTLEANALEAQSCLRTILSTLAIDGPLLTEVPSQLPDWCIDLLKRAYAHGFNDAVGEVKAKDGQFRVTIDGSGDGLDWEFEGDVFIDASEIDECITVPSQIDDTLEVSTFLFTDYSPRGENKSEQ
tara:strand:+ start:68 stop:499 length:432 start_codon:yes stop_codon:yes gene_type:complete